MKQKPWNLRAFTAAVLWVIALMTAPFVTAQTVNVSGTVSDQTGEVMIGVSVSVKGDQKHAAATDFDGNYILTMYLQTARWCSATSDSARWKWL